jgi:hypothetical protein
MEGVEGPMTKQNGQRANQTRLKNKQPENRRNRTLAIITAI